MIDFASSGSFDMTINKNTTFLVSKLSSYTCIEENFTRSSRFKFKKHHMNWFKSNGHLTCPTYLSVILGADILTTNILAKS